MENNESTSTAELLTPACWSGTKGACRASLANAPIQPMAWPSGDQSCPDLETPILLFPGTVHPLASELRSEVNLVWRPEAVRQDFGVSSGPPSPKETMIYWPKRADSGLHVQLDLSPGDVIQQTVPVLLGGYSSHGTQHGCWWPAHSLLGCHLFWHLSVPGVPPSASHSWAPGSLPPLSLELPGAAQHSRKPSWKGCLHLNVVALGEIAEAKLCQQAGRMDGAKFLAVAQCGDFRATKQLVLAVSRLTIYLPPSSAGQQCLESRSTSGSQLPADLNSPTHRLEKGSSEWLL